MVISAITGTFTCDNPNNYGKIGFLSTQIVAITCNRTTVTVVSNKIRVAIIFGLFCENRFFAQANNNLLVPI